MGGNGRQPHNRDRDASDGGNAKSSQEPAINERKRLRFFQPLPVCLAALPEIGSSV